MNNFQYHKVLLGLLPFILWTNLLWGQEYYNSSSFKNIDKERKEIDQKDSSAVIKFIDTWEAMAVDADDSVAIAYVWMTAAKMHQIIDANAQGKEYAIKASGVISRYKLKGKFIYNKKYLAAYEVEEGNFEKGIELALQSVDEFSELRPYDNRTNYHALSSAYLSMHNYDRMDYYLQKWYELVSEKNIRMDLGFAIYNMHEYYDYAKMYDKASRYQDEYYRFYADKGKDITEIPEHAFITISGDTAEETIEKLNKYLPYHIENGRDNFVSQTHGHLGRLYLETNDAVAAEGHFKKAVAITNGVSLENQIDALSGLAESQSLIGSHKDAFESTSQYIALLDSFKNNQVLAQANELEAKYENDKNELQLELKESQLKAKNRWLMLMGIAGLILIFLSGFTMYLYRKLRDSNLILTKTVGEKETLLQEIHHRVKNNLQVISSLLNLQSRYVQDESAVSALNEGQTRVESMALIHQNLYREDNITGVNMKNCNTPVPIVN